MLDSRKKFCYTDINKEQNMAIDGRYEAITRPPQVGETLASTALLQNYAEVLETAQKNMQNGDGAYYVMQPTVREVA